MSERSVKALHYILLAIIALVFVLPLIWLVVASFDMGANQSLKWPDQWTFSNYANVLTNASNLKGFGIGLVIAGVQALVVCVISVLAAYPLSRYNLCYKKGLMYGILFMTALPMIAVIVPVYKMFLKIGLLDSIPGVILYLSASALPYGIWLMKNFMDAIPVELEEAAKLDGCSTYRMFFTIIFPLSRPIIIPLCIAFFLGNWNNYLWPLIVNKKPEYRTIMVYLANMVGGYNTKWNVVIASAMLACLPVFLISLFLQSHLQNSIKMSGIK